MTELALFDMDPTVPVPEPAEPISADRRRTIRQAEAIARGVHPLALVVPTIRMHPDTDRGARPGDGIKTLRCGSCKWRALWLWHNKTYPKCTNLHGRPTRPLTTHGAATDCRAWWPACTAYEETT